MTENARNHTLWAELVSVRRENDSLEQELATAHAANERLSVILGAINEKLRAQLEALAAKGLDTAERRQVSTQLVDGLMDCLID